MKSIQPKNKGSFSFKAYFRFRHSPFNILNILSTKEENFRFSVFKTTAIIFIGFIVTILAAYTFVAFDYRDRMEMDRADASMRIEELKSAYDLVEEPLLLEPEFQKLKIYEDLNQETKYVIDLEIDFRERPRDWKSRITYFYKGQSIIDTTEVVSGMAEYSLALGSIRNSLNTAVKEYKLRINESELSGYNLRLRDNIEILYSKIKQPEIDMEMNDMAVALIEGDNLFGNANGKIFIHLNVYQKLQELGLELRRLGAEFPINQINKAYDKRNVKESELSRAIRLKIIETKISEHLINECKTDECKDEIIGLTG